VSEEFGSEHEPSPEWDAKYDELNERYWKGNLPKYHVFFVENLGDPRLPEGHQEEMGWTGHSLREVLVNAAAKSDPERTESILVHEMAHVAVGPKVFEAHGREWQDEVLRLIKLGRDEQWDALAISGLQTGRTELLTLAANAGVDMGDVAFDRGCTTHLSWRSDSRNGRRATDPNGRDL
jgi:hypothetical protein